MMRFVMTGAIGASLLLSGCSGGEVKAPSSDTEPSTVLASASSTGATVVTPDAGGKVVEVEMITDENGNYFKPADFEVKRGDVVRFILMQGVHNAHFVADSNPGKPGLPPAGPLLQLPGQKYDVKADWMPGTYFYHCDPHALLGMIGHVTVLP